MLSARWRRVAGIGLALALASCVRADPAGVDRAVRATLTAAVPPTPIVVVVTAVPNGPTPPPAASATPAAPDALIPPPAASAPPTSTSGVTPSPTASATPAALGSLPANLGAAVLDDEFLLPGLWELGEDAERRVELAGGLLTITLKVADRFTVLYNNQLQAGDFYAVLSGGAADCHFRDRYGLDFRLQDGGNYYQFEVDCDGRYRLAKVVNGALTSLHDWTEHPAIRAGVGAANQLAVLAVGSRLEVFVNGQALAQTSDSAFSAGGFGLYAGSGLTGAYSAVFERVQVWELKP